MLSKELNERLTQVGRGTPGGELLRRYWHAVCPAAELTRERPIKRVRLLGEDLVLFQEPDGSYGAMAEQCAHRGCSLYYGFLEGGGLRHIAAVRDVLGADVLAAGMGRGGAGRRRIHAPELVFTPPRCGMDEHPIHRNIELCWRGDGGVAPSFCAYQLAGNLSELPPSFHV